ncbi:MAG: phosphatase PAP2 family protein [Bacteroidales bacterium]|nr:phosphatase PAP2 family protein [Bacteroidales bacterium]
MEWIKDIDTNIFLFINGLFSPTGDFVFSWMSTTVIWIPLYLFLIFLLAKKHKKNFWIIALGIAALIATTDIVSAHILKPLVMRPRPCHEPTLAGLVHIVGNKCGGQYGFVSSHATNIFGIATFCHLALRTYYKYTWLLFIWAAVIGYSRIYLGVHYPLDVLCGAILGIGIAIGIWQLILIIKLKYKHHENC